MGGSESVLPTEPEDPHTHASGELFLYHDEYALSAFEFGKTEGTRALVCIAGLTDGFLSIRYLPRLVDVVAPLGWRVFQPILRSSYSGWGLGSLDEDVADIDFLLDNLAAERGITSVCLLGHSTGCQDVVKYLSSGANVGMVKAVVLQAPVSDRQALELTNTGNRASFDADIAKYVTMATTMIGQGKGDEIMPRAACLMIGPPHAITAYRFHSLTGRMTDDDMFSSDLTDGELSRRFYHMHVPTLIAMALDDEYVPKTVDMKALAERMQAASAQELQTQLIPSGGHSLNQPEGRNAFLLRVRQFLTELKDPQQPQ